MARRTKNGGRAGRKKVWSETDLIQLWAWLDYCLLHGIDFKKTVVRQLKKATGRDFLERQVLDKLQREWTGWGNETSQSLDDVYSQGSACIKLSQDGRRDIEKAIDVIAKNSRTDRLSRVSSPRTRSQSRALVLPVDRVSSSVSTLSSFTPPARPSETHHHDLAEDGIWIKCEGRGSSAQQPSSTGTQTNNETLKEAEVLVQVAEKTKTQLSKITKTLEARDGEVARQRSEIFSLYNRLAATRKERVVMNNCAQAATYDGGNPDTIQKLRYENSLLKKQIFDQQILQEVADSITMDGPGSLPPTSAEIRQEFDTIERSISDLWFSVEAAPPLVLSQVCDIIEGGDEIISVWAEIVSHEPHRIKETILSSSNHEENPDSSSSSYSELWRSLIAVGLCTLTFATDLSEILILGSPLIDHYRRLILCHCGPTMLQAFDLQANRSLISEHYFEEHLIPTQAASVAETLASAANQLLFTCRTPPSQQLLPQPQSPDRQRRNSLDDDDDAVDNAFTIAFQEICTRALMLRGRLGFLSSSSSSSSSFSSSSFAAPQHHHRRRRYVLVFAQPGQVFDYSTMNRDGWINDGGGYQRRGEADQVRKKKKMMMMMMNMKTGRRDGSAAVDEPKCGGSREEEGKRITTVRLCLFPALYSVSSWIGGGGGEGEGEGEGHHSPEDLLRSSDSCNGRHDQEGILSISRTIPSEAQGARLVVKAVVSVHD